MSAAVLPVLTPLNPETAPRITLEQYLRTTYKPDCDFVDGVLEERNVGEFPHNRLQILIGGWLLANEAAFSVVVVPEQRIQVGKGRMRVADLCLLRADLPRENVVTQAPLLCIEIFSPEDRISRARKVLEDYHAMGVPLCWLIDPVHRMAYSFDAGGLRLLDSTERLELPGTPVFLPLDELFARLD